MKIIITGDYCDRLRVAENLLADDSYMPFADFAEIISRSDLAITNLESPIVSDKAIKPIKKTGPNLKSDPLSIKLLKKSGFQLVTLANNHMMDYGVEGLISTFKYCDGEISVVGAGLNKAESTKPFIFECQGRKYGIINACENEWSTTDGAAPGCCPMDEITLWSIINDACHKVDSLIVIIHGGHEGYELPSPRMVRLYRWCVDLGADAVIGHHTHCFSGYEIYKDKPIVYSLGNWLFDRREKDDKWNYGALAELDFNPSGVVKLSLHPYEQCLYNPIIKRLSDDQFMKWQSDVAFVAERISNDAKYIERSFENFCRSNTKTALDWIEPFQNRILNVLRSHNLCPRLITLRQKRLFLNMIRDESHRDKLINILKNIYNEDCNS